MNIAVNFVTPQRWQKYHRIGPGPDAAVQKAIQLYPNLHAQLVRKKDHHKADAALIAAFGVSLLKRNVSVRDRAEHAAKPATDASDRTTTAGSVTC
jgi:hypothetical protein